MGEFPVLNFSLSKYIPLPKPLLHFKLVEVNTVALCPTFMLIAVEHC